MDNVCILGDESIYVWEKIYAEMEYENTCNTHTSGST